MSPIRRSQENRYVFFTGGRINEINDSPQTKTEKSLAIIVPLLNIPKLKADKMKQKGNFHLKHLGM